jgi:putative ABC transport system permease protein
MEHREPARRSGSRPAEQNLPWDEVKKGESPMTVLELVYKELLRRKGGFLLACSAVALAGAGVVFTQTFNTGVTDAMRRITKSLGTNVLILPVETDVGSFWQGYAGAGEMPESYVQKIARSKVAAEHFIGKLQKRIELGGRSAVLCGISGEVGRVGMMKKSMPSAYRPREEECYLGSSLAQRLDAAVGQQVEVEGRSFRVGRVLKPVAPVEDITVFVNLHVAQEMMGKPGIISGMEALGCLCAIPEIGDTRYITDVEMQIRNALPGTQVASYLRIARARLAARHATGLAGRMTVWTLAALALFVIAFYLYGDVRDRHAEIGMFMAMGVRPRRVALIFLTKLAVIAVIGGAVGFALGSFAAIKIGPSAMGLIAIRPKVVWSTAMWSVAGALVLALLAGFLPTLMATRTDPAEVLGSR